MCECYQFYRMRITQSAQICLSVIKKSQKTGFGPNRLQRKGTHFVGTEPPVLKYHIVSHFGGFKYLLINIQLQDKKPNEEYGLQGTNHELPGTGKVHSKLPTKVFKYITRMLPSELIFLQVHMKKDKVYAWCSCGYSGSQPLCDGSHNSIRIPDLKLKPVRFIPDKDMTVWLCNCKQTNNR